MFAVVAVIAICGRDVPCCDTCSQNSIAQLVMGVLLAMGILLAMGVVVRLVVLLARLIDRKRGR